MKRLRMLCSNCGRYSKKCVPFGRWKQEILALCPACERLPENQ